MSLISDHFKNLKRKRPEAENPVEISSDEDAPSGKEKSPDDPKEIHKKVSSGEIQGTYKLLDEIDSTKNFDGILKNEMVIK